MTSRSVSSTWRWSGLYVTSLASVGRLMIWWGIFFRSQKVMVFLHSLGLYMHLCTNCNLFPCFPPIFITCADFQPRRTMVDNNLHGLYHQDLGPTIWQVRPPVAFSRASSRQTFDESSACCSEAGEDQVLLIFTFWMIYSAWFCTMTFLLSVQCNRLFR